MTDQKQASVGEPQSARTDQEVQLGATTSPSAPGMTPVALPGAQPGVTAGGTLARSWPMITLIAGVCALALVLATVVGYQMGTNGGQQSTGLAESAAAAGLDPTVPYDDEQEQDEEPQPEPQAPSPGADAPAPKNDPNALIQAPPGRGMLHVKPISVAIPRIEVSSTLVDLGLNPDNSLEVPQDYSKAGWYARGSYPGDSSGPPALIVGHVDNSEGPAVFYALEQLGIGDEILVTRADGSTAVFVVYDGKQYAKSSLPTDELYAHRDGSELVLITCSGEFNTESGSYLDNYVVRAKLDRKRSGLST